MSRDDDEEDDWEDDFDVVDDAEDGWDGGDDSGDEPTVPCPYCRRALLEDSPWCPSCDRSITEEELRRADRPVWVVVTALVCLAIALWWAFVSF